MTLPDGNEALMGNGIFSRFPLTHKQTVSVMKRDIEKGGAVQDNRSYLQTTVEVSEGMALTVGTVHLPFHPQFKTTPAANSILDKVLASLPAEDDVLLMGDLNRSPYTRAARRLHEAGFYNIGAGLRQPTWTTKPFKIGSWEYDTLRWRLDFMLYRGNARRLRADVATTDLSDHLPLVTDVEIG
jgi:endonuclease/exonuclease/phosphatase family metal-dependent hydrolase